MEKAGKWKKLEDGRKWKMEKAGKGKSWKRKKLGKRKNKCLTMYPENDRILTTGKTRPAGTLEKKNGG